MLCSPTAQGSRGTYLLQLVLKQGGTPTARDKSLVVWQEYHHMSPFLSGQWDLCWPSTLHQGRSYPLGEKPQHQGHGLDVP